MNTTRKYRTFTVLPCLLSLLSVVQLGCATSGTPLDFDDVVIENASPDVVRVSMELGGRELLLGSVRPMSREALPIRRGTLPPALGNARIRVVPVGAPSAQMKPGERTSAAAIYSDLYRAEEFITFEWRYSGSRVLPLGPRRR